VILEEGLKKLEADHGVLAASVSEHERTLAGVQVCRAFVLHFCVSVSFCFSGATELIISHADYVGRRG